MKINFERVLLSIVMAFSSVFIFGQKEIKKRNDSLPVIKIVGATKIYSADKSLNDQLKSSSFFLNNNEVTYKTTQGKVDSLIGASKESRKRKVFKKKNIAK
ncbi:hypothetical protein NZ698_06755 [Chryseobacterium sp. PBS4-4]|uniref:Uncharacterized protein n=1 Tax=Chryseobacterium edaphi TaxID=2976532 RepID=A0ABT2W3T7_9FLAO|nr:hypothetical protein [Chryseobacterium edaphi]MCU7616891.1 hypothetical protein [Chryseobacterium edaphi]